MSTGNYDHDNFVRVDCAASSEQFRINAIHETAHFSLIKQSFFGLLCFFLRQDTRDARSPLEPAQRTLEQAFECTNECYARAKELFLCTHFPQPISDSGRPFWLRSGPNHISGAITWNALRQSCFNMIWRFGVPSSPIVSSLWPPRWT